MLKNLKASSLILPLLMLILTPLGVFADEGPTPGQIAGNNAWMLTSTALVLLMTIPGVALFYGGLSRKQNVLSTLMHVFAGSCVVTITWCVIGYSIAYSEGTPFYGGLGNFLFKGMTFNQSPEGLPMGVDVTVPEGVDDIIRIQFSGMWGHAHGGEGNSMIKLLFDR